MTIADRDRTLRLRSVVVLEDLLHESGRRGRERTVALDGMVAARLDGAGRHEHLGPLVDHREADVDVVEKHVRGAIEADVLDLVVDGQARLADPGLDPSPEQELLAEDRGLERLTLRPEDAVVAVPALPVADETSRPVRDPTVEAGTPRSASADSGTARPCPSP